MEARANGPACPQAGLALLVENCLFLNVFAPETARPGAKLPVIVWFHGGGFRAGSGGDGPRLWARDGFVVVSFNYRLGVLGFRDWPGWDASHPRNFGQADMVAALRWVRANIGSFGGDHRQVTLHGHSAGGMGVTLMLSDPRARGLFHRAVADAGYGAWPFPAAMNPTPEMRQRMKYRNLETDAPLAELVDQTPYFHLPVTGGADLPDQPQTLLEQGKGARVPVLFGFTSYDGGGTMGGAGFTPESFLALFEKPDAVRAAYATDFAISDLQGAERAFGDRRYGLSSRAAARAVAKHGGKAWLFHVTGPADGGAGVRHGAYYRDLFGARGTTDMPLGRYVVNFARTGNPNGADLPQWRNHSPSSDAWMVFDPAPAPAVGVLKDRLDALEQLALNP